MPVHERYQSFVKDQREFFDGLITEDWHTYLSADWDYVRRYEVKSLFKRIQPKTVFDVGCGCGFHDREMGEYSFIDRITAIDYSAKSIEVAEREYPHPKVKRFVGDFEEFPREEKYDLVVSFQVIEHLENAAAFLKFCADHCAESGNVAVFTPNRLRWANRLLRLKGQREQFCDVQHFREFSTRDLKVLGSDAGLIPVCWFGYSFSGPGLGWLDARGIALRTRLGAWLPWAANGISMVFRKA